MRPFAIASAHATGLQVFFVQGSVAQGIRALLRTLQLESHHTVVVHGVPLSLTRLPCAIVPAPTLANGNLDVEALAGVLDDSVQLIIVPHVEPTTATILDALRVADLAHGSGARVLLDATGTVGRLADDLTISTVDFWVASGHAYLRAARGVTACAVRDSSDAAALRSDPMFCGLNQAYGEEAEAFGTLAFVAAFAAACGYLSVVGLPTVQSRLSLLVQELRIGLSSIPHLDVQPPDDTEGSVAVLFCCSDELQLSVADFERLLLSEGVTVGSSASTLQAHVHYYNSLEEIRHAVMRIRTVVSRQAGPDAVDDWTDLTASAIARLSESTVSLSASRSGSEGSVLSESVSPTSLATSCAGDTASAASELVSPMTCLVEIDNGVRSIQTSDDEATDDLVEIAGHVKIPARVVADGSDHASDGCHLTVPNVFDIDHGVRSIHTSDDETAEDLVPILDEYQSTLEPGPEGCRPAEGGSPETAGLSVHPIDSGLRSIQASEDEAVEEARDCGENVEAPCQTDVALNIGICSVPTSEDEDITTADSSTSPEPENDLFESAIAPGSPVMDRVGGTREETMKASRSSLRSSIDSGSEDELPQQVRPFRMRRHVRSQSTSASEESSSEDEQSDCFLSHQLEFLSENSLAVSYSDPETAGASSLTEELAEIAYAALSTESETESEAEAERALQTPQHVPSMPPHAWSDLELWVDQSSQADTDSDGESSDFAEVNADTIAFQNPLFGINPEEVYTLRATMSVSTVASDAEFDTTDTEDESLRSHQSSPVGIAMSSAVSRPIAIRRSSIRSGYENTPDSEMTIGLHAVLRGCDAAGVTAPLQRSPHLVAMTPPEHSVLTLEDLRSCTPPPIRGFDRSQLSFSGLGGHVFGDVRAAVDTKSCGGETILGPQMCGGL